jgi:hypothetical protein
MTKLHAQCAFLVSALHLAMSGCTKAPISAVSAPLPAVEASLPVLEGDLENYTSAQRGHFKAELATVLRRFDAEALLLNNAGIKAAASLNSWEAAKAGLTRARHSLSEKMTVLDRATDDDWKAARDDVAVAWRTTKKAYCDLREGRLHE